MIGYINPNTLTNAVRPSVFAPVPAPGAPFADYNAEGLTPGDIATWSNGGSDATGDLSTGGSSNAPACVAAGAGSPVPGAQYVSFDKANTEALVGSLTTARSTGIVFAAVMRWTAANSAIEAMFDGDDATNRCKFYRRAVADNYSWAMYAGNVGQYSGAAAEENRWVRVVGTFHNTTGFCSIERVQHVISDGTMGTASLDGLTLGAKNDQTEYGAFDVARLTFWDDSTTPLEAERWLEQAYPFNPVPPGNPVHWYDPNDYPVGSVSTLRDKGSGGEDLTCTAMTVGLDTDCPEQKVFVFNGTTSKAIDGGAYATLTGDIHLYAACVRFNGAGATEVLFGDSANRGGAGNIYYCFVDTNNVVQRGFSTQAAGSDMDTLAPFNTRLRWANMQFLTAAAAGNGGTYVDGTLSGAATEGDNDPDSLSIGANWNSGGTAYANFVDGNMSDVIIYTGASEANAARAAEVEMWLQRHRKLSTQPGTPFLDVDAESISQADRSALVTWTDDASANDLTQASATLQPTFRIADGPELGVGQLSVGNSIQRVNFSLDYEYMDSTSTFTAKTQPGAAALVFRPEAGLSIAVWSASDTGTTAWQARVLGTPLPAKSTADSGATLSTATSAISANAWHWMALEFNGATSHVSDSAGGTASGNAGTETHGTKHRVGAAPNASSGCQGDIARVVYWADGTTWEQVAEWLARRYPGSDPY